jgi:predicted nucleotidyltransferase
MTETPSGLQPVEASAKALFLRALRHCARQSGESLHGVLDRLRACDLEMHGTFRYALAKGVAEYLGSLGVPFRAIYVYGSSMAEASSPCSDIDIVLDLDHEADEVDRLMHGLDIALVTQFRALFPWAHRLVSLLDVRSVAGRSENGRNDYSGEFSGLGTFPICLWRFTPEARGDLRSEVPPAVRRR